MNVVLDASALLAWLHGEAGAESVDVALTEAAISSVNWAEVVQKALGRGVDVAGMREDLAALGLNVVPFDAEDAERAGRLWSLTQPYGLSLGDRACLALGLRLATPVLTADRAWAPLEATLGISIRVAR